MIKILSVFFIVIIWSTYSLRFGVDYLSTQGADVWGQFGDYMGGVLNPILSFISICLLIRSLGLQVKSNNIFHKEIQRQESLEEYKKFEIRFFSLIQSQDVNFNNFRILIDDGVQDDQVDFQGDKEQALQKIIEFKSGAAVGYIDDSLSTLMQAAINKERVVDWLNDLDVDDRYFSLVRRFYLIIKLINEKTQDDEKNEQFEVLVNLTDDKLLTIICILCEFYDWDNISYIKNSGVLNMEGLKDYISKYKVVY